MSYWDGVRYVLRSWFRSGKSQMERDEEYEFHRNMERRRLISYGVPASTARQHVDSEFAWRQPQVPEVRWQLDCLLDDVRVAVRTLRRTPAYTVSTFTTVAGAVVVAAMASAIWGAMYVRPLPFPDDDRLVVLMQTDRDRPDGFKVSLPNFREWELRTRNFASMAAWETRIAAVAGHNEGARSATVAQVTGDFFKVLKVQPLLGRVLSRLDEDSDELAVVVSYRLWERELGRDSLIVGKTIVVDGRAVTIHGVMPPNVRYPASADLWMSWPRSRQQYLARNTITENVVARMAGGISVKSASQEVDRISRTLHSEYPDLTLNQATGAFAQSLREVLFGDERSLVWLLGMSAAFVCLAVGLNLACANFARTIDRAAEFEVRAALGAPRWRMLQSACTEFALLVAIATLVGLMAAPVVIRSVWNAGYFEALQTVQPSVNALSAGVSVAFALAIVIVSGFLPTAYSVRARKRFINRAEIRRTLSSGQTTRALLVGLQSVVATVLIVGAGLATGSMLRILAKPRGFDSSNVMTVDLRLPLLAPQKSTVLMNTILDSVRTLPGVIAAGAVNRLPLTADPGFSSRSASAIAAQAIGGRSVDGTVGAGFHAVDGDYFAAMRIALISGRAFLTTDNNSAPRVAVVNAAMASRFWPGENAVGRTFRAYGGDAQLANQDITVIGVVENVRTQSLEDAPLPDYYVSFAQGIDVGWHRYLVVRFDQSTTAYIGAIRRQLKAIDPRVAADFASMDDRLQQSLARRRFAGTALGVVALVGLLIVVVGVFGVVAVAVSSRRRELGIRGALGATSLQLVKLIVGTAVTPVIVGSTIGLGVSLLLEDLLRVVVFDLSPHEPRIFLVAILSLVLTSILAGLIPARQAARISPIEALRAN